jgi:hypothetical protein
VATELLIQRDGNRLVAADPYSLDALQGLPKGQTLNVTIKRPRNVKHHRKFFALLGIVYDAQSRYPTTDHLLNAIKIAIGHYDLVPLTKKHTVIQTRSISFASMDQAAFEQFYDRVILVIVKDILPGVQAKELEAQVLDIIGESYA